MLMQAAQQILLFFGPRAGGDADETFDERTLRRACIKAVIDHGFGPALAIQIGANRIMEVRCLALFPFFFLVWGWFLFFFFGGGERGNISP